MDNQEFLARLNYLDSVFQTNKSLINALDYYDRLWVDDIYTVLTDLICDVESDVADTV